jgi:hypothetical protein
MEAYRAYDSGEEWQLSKDELAGLDSVGEEFQPVPYERELLLQFFLPVSQGGGYAESLTTTEIKDILETNTKQRLYSLRKLGVELKNLYGKSSSKRVGSSIVKVYNVIRVNDKTTNNETVSDIPF